MIITEQLALQIGYNYRFTYENKTVYFRTYLAMLIEFRLLPTSVYEDLHMERYDEVTDTWFDLN